MTEHEADQVMDWVADVSSWNPDDVGIKHMYEIHKLRDQAVYHNILYGDGCITLWPDLDDMQTF